MAHESFFLLSASRNIRKYHFMNIRDMEIQYERRYYRIEGGEGVVNSFVVDGDDIDDRYEKRYKGYVNGKKLRLVNA